VGNGDELHRSVDLGQPVAVAVAVAILDFGEQRIERRAGVDAAGDSVMQVCDDLEILAFGPVIDVDGWIESNRPSAHFSSLSLSSSFFSTTLAGTAFSQASESRSNC
jgi:hypothetical protein